MMGKSIRCEAGILKWKNIDYDDLHQRRRSRNTKGAARG
jgi:hypothetical protein